MPRLARAGLLLAAVGLAPPLRAPALRAQPAPLAGLDEYVERSMAEWGVPGLALAVVKDDSVVLAKGYGVREVGKPDPVTDRTLFAIGSTTKAFTAAALAILVDEGRLGWDDRVIDHLPEFRLHDPFVTREIRIRDLLTHRSGLPRGDRVWYGTPYDRDEVLRRVRYLEPAWSFRTHYGYQNIMFLAAGQVVARVTGTSWDDFLRERILRPLGMTETNTSVRELPEAADVATPHVKVEEEVRPIPWRNIDNVGPAGSINSNVREMARWIRLQLGEGTFAGEEIVSPEAVREMHAP